MNPTLGKYKPKKFTYRPHHLKGKRTVLDVNCLESTPEIMRMDIDNIFKEFVNNPDANEYIFPSDLTNLQRKYIHFVAQKMNIISKSYGKEPDRKLHIRKKNKQLSNQCFMIIPSEASKKHLQTFVDSPIPEPNELQKSSSSFNVHKVYGKLIHSQPGTPEVMSVLPEIANIRKSLPVYENKDDIIYAINNNQIVVISSETGSGKTTQIPQYIIEDAALYKKPCKIICTQPRRISTVAAAERVSYERGDMLGSSVGYHIKLEQKYGFNTNIIFCTTGVFLRNLMGGADGFGSITHIIIDEIHERDKLSDFLLICIKQNLCQYPNLKIILMSATINTNKFVEYFQNVKVLCIPGRLYSIDTLFLEDVLELTKYMSPKMKQAELKEKSILIFRNDVFSPEIEMGIEEGNLCVDEALDEYLNYSDKYDYRIHYEEATAQLRMYFLSEDIAVDYQHSNTGRTALMIAVCLDDREFISRLCNMGANLDICCKLGKTVFDYAQDNREVLRLLGYVKDKRNVGTTVSDESNNKEHLLELFNKTTPDDIIDYDLIVTVIKYIHMNFTAGAILVFLPGYDEIMLCNDGIVNSEVDPSTYKIFFLHGSMNIRDQNEVFRSSTKHRKIILSTNIAETSITIDDVVFVVDIGKAKEKCFDAYNKVSSLQTRWISQACANQRKGRAGRTRPGVCFRLYSKQRYDNTDPERIPEILRVSLEELCLHAKVLAPEDMNIHNFLTLAPDAPSANSVKVAIENLQFLGALDKEEDLTRLGAYLSQLTIEPHLGKMLIYAVIFRCLEPVLTLVASLGHKDPFQLPPQANLKSFAAERRRALIDGVMSDHILFLEVFKKWQEASCTGKANRFCQEYYISHSTMNSILETRSQLMGQLRAIKFIHQSNNPGEYNIYANCWPLVKAIICTGVYPNLAYPCQNSLATRREKKISIQSSSACANQLITTWLVYDEMIKHRNGLFIRGVTAVTTLTISLFCGIDIVTPSPTMLNIDDWIEFEYPDHSIIYLRNSVEFLVKTFLSTPWYTYNNFDKLVTQTIRNVLECEEIYAGLKVPYNVGDKPKFFLPKKHAPHRSSGGPSSIKISSGSQHKQFDNGTDRIQNGYHRPTGLQSGGQNVQHRNGYANCEYKNDNGRHTGAIKKIPAQVAHFNSNPNSMCQSVQSLNLASENPGDLFMNALKNNCSMQSLTRPGSETRALSEEVSDKVIYMLIKPRQRQNVEIAFQTSKWIFAPQTEKKIIAYCSVWKTVYLLFTVNHSNAFQGVAKYLHIYSESGGKPTAVIKWLFKTELPFINVKHLRNPYNGNRPIYEGVDGQIIQEQVAEEFMRVFAGINKHYRQFNAR